MKKPTCPACHSTDVAEIAYGLILPPETPEEIEAMENVVLGGCCVDDNSAQWHCRNCAHEF